MAIHSSILVWQITWTEEPGAGYCPWGRKELDTTEPLHFTFCHKGGVICISEVIDISPRNLDSSLCFFQLY